MFPPGILHLNMNLPYQSLTLLPPWHLSPCPDPNGDIPPLAGRIPTSIGRHCQRGLWGTTPLKAKGWDASSQSIDGEPVGSLHQGFGSSMEGKRRLLQDKPSDIFQDMIASAGLLGSKSMRSRRSGEGRGELGYANNKLKTLPKGLQFFHPYHPQNHPKSWG